MPEPAALDRLALRTPDGATSLTWRDYGTWVRRIATGLLDRGIGPGATAGIMLADRPEFDLVDTATLHLGAANVSVYNTLPVSGIVHVLRGGGCAVLMTEQSFLDRAMRAAKDVGIPVLTVDGDADGVIPTIKSIESDRPHGPSPRSTAASRRSRCARTRSRSPPTFRSGPTGCAPARPMTKLLRRPRDHKHVVDIEEVYARATA